MKLRAATCSTCSIELLTAALPLLPTARWLPCENFHWCVARDILRPRLAGVKPPTAERSRDRVLSDDELDSFVGR
jgi:hypothetical protein